MKQSDVLKKISVLLNENGISFDVVQKKQLVDYVQLLREWSGQINLVSKTDRDFIWERHIVPSLIYALFLPEDGISGSDILDFGSGAGFPGVVLSVLFKENNLALLDSNRKKCLFLKHVRKRLNLNYSILNDRLENRIKDNGNRFSVVVARAVASLPDLIRYVDPVLQKPGCLMVLKGDTYRQELSEFEIPAHILISEKKIPETWNNHFSYLKNKRFVVVEYTNV